MPTSKQGRDFANYFMECMSAPLSTAIDWIADNLQPEDVFSETKLEKWALANGYVKQTDN